MSKPLRLAILLSGKGSNLQAIINQIESKRLNANIVIVASNRRDAGGLLIANKHNIEHFYLDANQFATREEFDNALANRIKLCHPDLVVLAGYMKILSKEFVNVFPNQLINIHPSLLPKFKGLDTHKRVLEAKEQKHGCTVHFVNHELDGGPIIAQASCIIDPLDTEQSLKEKVQTLEHELYPKVISWIEQGWVKFDGTHLQMSPEIESIHKANTLAMES